MDEEDAIFALKKVKKTFDCQNLNYWLDCGTLLGAVRNGRFLPWDDDIDLGVWLKNYPRVKKACEKLPNDFTVQFLDINYMNNTEKKICINNFSSTVKIDYKDFHVDVALYNIEKNKAIRKIGKENNFFKNIINILIKSLIWKEPKNVVSKPLPEIFKFLIKLLNILPNNITNKILKNFVITYDKCFSSDLYFSIPKHFFENLSTIKFYDMEFPVPNPKEEYLEYRYGENWKIPKKDYVFYEEDQSIKK